MIVGAFFSSSCEVTATELIVRFGPIRKRIPLDYPCSIHDFGLSEHYAVFYLSPYLLNTAALIREGRSLLDSLNWEPERGSRLLIVGRDSGEVVASVFVGNRYCLHLMNCFQEGGRLIVDVIDLERPIYNQYQPLPNLFMDVCAGRPVRLVIDAQSWRLSDQKEIDYQCAPDFPTIDQRKLGSNYRDFWMLGISKTGKRGRKFFDQLVHADWNERSARDVYQAPSLNYLSGEPIYIGDPRNAGDGAVICQLFDADRVASGFAIFDAFNVARGPVATLRLKHPMPFGFHASFWPKVTAWGGIDLLKKRSGDVVIETRRRHDRVGAELLRPRDRPQSQTSKPRSSRRQVVGRVRSDTLHSRPRRFSRLRRETDSSRAY